MHPQFDYLKSQEIEEKINKIRWVQQGANQSRFLLTTNDKTIKLWKVFEKRVRALANFNVPDTDRAASCELADLSGAQSPPAMGVSADRGGSHTTRVFTSPELLRIPRVVATDAVLAARCRRVYPNTHTYHIHSLSVNSDCTTFISADDLRVNLWSLETGGTQSFTMVDMKPDNMEDLTEVITAAVFHPSNCALFAFSSSRGAIRLADMRERAMCSSHARLFEEPEAPGTRSFFSEIIASISDVQFGAGGRYLVSRDYLTLKLWDVAMEHRPVATFAVHDALRGKLCDVYENDAIFDKFECVMAADGRHVATGSYGFLMRVFDTHTGADATVEVSKDPGRARLQWSGSAQPPPSPRAGDDGDVLMSDAVSGVLASAAQPQLPPPAGSGVIDPASKLLHLAWHPRSSEVAAAAGSSLYIMGARHEQRAEHHMDLWTQ